MRRMLLSFACLCVLTIAANAATVYSYTGPTFDSAQAPFTTNDYVSGSFTLASPLGSNFSGQVTPTTYAFTVGSQSFTPSVSVFQSFIFTTDANGSITSYYIGFDNPTYSLFLELDAPNSHATGVYLNQNNPFVVSARTSQAGTITAQVPSSVTPEPSSLALLGTGLLGITGALRKRFS